MSVAHSATVSSAVHSGVAVITVNNPPLNVLGATVRDGLHKALHAAEASSDVSAIVLCGAGRSFPAGADVKEFPAAAAGSGGPSAAVSSLSAVIDEVERCSKPVVSALHGFALGGGLELALGSHARVALSSARVGLPEVALGIIPGAGGTQRLPRLVGLPMALQMIVTGAHVPAGKAAKAGIVDLVVKGSDYDALIAAACKHAASLTSADLSSLRISTRAVPGSEKEQRSAVAKWAAFCQTKRRGYLAPAAAVRAVAASAEQPFSCGMALESDLIGGLMRGSQAGAQQYLFFAERAARALPSELSRAKPTRIRSAGIVGAGTMGMGIALCFMRAGIPVTVLEREQRFLDRGRATAQARLASAVKKGRMSKAAAEKQMALLTLSLDYAALSDVDCAIEAVFESMDVKKAVFRALDAACPPRAFLFTNTSGLDVDEIAAVTSRPDKVMGTHFFSPAHVMKLLENVRGAASSADTLATGMALGRTLGKVAVLVGNCRLFVGNRMLAGYSQEAQFLLEEGALPQQVDAALTGFGMPMGPLTMGDLAGLDLGWRARRGKPLPDDGIRRSTLRDKLCELGRFGQKTGKGWYAYRDGSRAPQPDAAVEALLVEHSAEIGMRRRNIGSQEMMERCMYPLINEGFRILQEGIAERPGDIDVIWAYGYGFPRFRGGPMFLADQIGLPRLLERLQYYSKQHPQSPHFKPAPLLSMLGKAGMSLSDYWAARQRTGSSALSKL